MIPEHHVIVVGLTGQTGAGKSTVSKVFVEHDFLLIDADKISREVVEPGRPCLDEIFDYFGDVIRNPDGTLNRKALAGIVFKDKKKRESLNSICYPFITEEILQRISQYAETEGQFVLLDAPTLFESRASDFCDMIISVVAPPEIRCERIMNRDGISKEAALDRMSAQLEESFFIRHSDYVIHNQDDLEQLIALSGEVADKVKMYLLDKI